MSESESRLVEVQCCYECKHLIQVYLPNFGGGYVCGAIKDRKKLLEPHRIPDACPLPKKVILSGETGAPGVFGFKF